MILLGTGVGVCFPALMTIAMSGATKSDAGLASGLVNTSAQVGGALGLAVLATLSASRTDHLIEQGKSTAAALTGGYHLAFWIAAALVVAAIVVALVVVQPEAKAAEQIEGERRAGGGAAPRRAGRLGGGLIRPAGPQGLSGRRGARCRRRAGPQEPR